MPDKTTIMKEAQKYLARGQIDRAIAEWEKLVNEAPEANTFNTIGDLYLRKGDKQSAVENFHGAARLFRTEGFSLKALALYKKVQAEDLRFRDVEQIWGVFVRALFYATPILYPIEAVPESFRDVVAANPLASIFEQARIWVVEPGAPTMTDVAGVGALLVSAVIFLGVCIAGLAYFDRAAPRVAEAL